MTIHIIGLKNSFVFINFINIANFISFHLNLRWVYVILYMGDLSSLLKGKEMTTISMSEIRLKLSELANRVIYGGERVVIEKNNKPAFALVSIEDLELLEQIDKDDIKAAKEALEEGNFIPFDQVKKELELSDDD